MATKTTSKKTKTQAKAKSKPAARRSRPKTGTPKAKTSTTRAKKADPRANDALATIGHEQIAQRAFELWVERGCPTGCDSDNWYEAERQLLAKAG